MVSSLVIVFYYTFVSHDEVFYFVIFYSSEGTEKDQCKLFIIFSHIQALNNDARILLALLHYFYFFL